MTTRQMSPNTEYCNIHHVVERIRVTSDSGRKYTVVRTWADKWRCSCPGWTMHVPRKDCKHIRHVKKIKHVA